jgi:hypothetical protein
MYVFVGIRLALGYRKTNFTEKNKLMMIGRAGASQVFLLLSRTRIRPHSGFDRGKRPRGRLKLGKSRSAS